MQGFALDWQQAAVLTFALTVTAAAATTSSVQRLRSLAPFVGEAAMIAGLYSVWQLAGRLSVLGTEGAYARAEWIDRVERDLHLPREADVQHVVTGDALVAQAANVYYATMHFGALFAFLLWLFVRHRDRYRSVRRVLALTTLVCLLVQLLPVAPPRLLSGYEDTAVQYGQSVYGLGFGEDALSAMPSVHVAWAVLVGAAVWRIGSGAGRWLGPVHAVLTVVVVVATANHFWADGIVAVVILALCAGIVRALEGALRNVGASRRSTRSERAVGSTA